MKSKQKKKSRKQKAKKSEFGKMLKKKLTKSPEGYWLAAGLLSNDKQFND